jgi:hypothetical protein
MDDTSGTDTKEMSKAMAVQHIASYTPFFLSSRPVSSSSNWEI